MSKSPGTIDSDAPQNQLVSLEGVGTPNLRALRAAQYLRMSTERQCYSIPNQINAIALYAQNHQMVIVRTFADEGKSGLSLDGRTGIVELFSLVQSGLADFKAILVYDVSRWGRFQDVDESSYWEYVCKRAGILVHYCAEPFINNGSFSSVIFKALKRTMAAEYSRELSDKVFAGQCRLIELGYRQGGRVGYGLRRMLVDHEGRPKGILHKGEAKCLQTDRVVLVPGPDEELKIVQEIYHAFVEKSRSQIGIAADLNARGIASGSKRGWSYNLVHEILINPKYIGANVYNRTSVRLKKRAIHNPEQLWVRRDGAFTPIVSTDLFQRAAERIESQKRRLSDEEMLDQLRTLLAKEGRLTGDLIDKSPHMLKRCAYAQRFGGLKAAYERLNYISRRNLSWVDIKRSLCIQRAEWQKEVLSQLMASGATVSINPKTGLMTINGEFGIRLKLAKCQRSIYGGLRWHIQQSSVPGCDLTVLARMNESNTHILDYYIFPRRDHLRDNVHLRRVNSVVLDSYRLDNLDPFYLSCRRRQSGQAGMKLNTYYRAPDATNNQPKILRPISHVRIGNMRDAGHREVKPAVEGHSAKQLESVFIEREYELRTGEQQALVERASRAREKISFLRSAMKTLLADKEFVALLRAEELHAIPEDLACDEPT